MTLREKLFMQALLMLVHKDSDGDLTTEVELAQQAADLAVQRMATGREIRGEPTLNPDVELDGASTADLSGLEQSLLKELEARLAALPDHGAAIEEVREKVRKHLETLTASVNSTDEAVTALEDERDKAQKALLSLAKDMDDLRSKCAGEIQSLKAEVAALKASPPAPVTTTTPEAPPDVPTTTTPAAPPPVATTTTPAAEPPETTSTTPAGEVVTTTTPAAEVPPPPPPVVTTTTPGEVPPPPPPTEV